MARLARVAGAIGMADYCPGARLSPAKDMSPDLIRGSLRPWVIFRRARHGRASLRAAVALPRSPRLTIDDEQLPVRVAQRYGRQRDGCRRKALRRDDVVMSNLAAHGQPSRAGRFCSAGFSGGADARGALRRPGEGALATCRRGPPAVHKTNIAELLES